MNSPTASRRPSKKVLIFAILLPLILLSALSISRGAILKYLVGQAVQAAAEKEILIKVHSLSTDKLEMSVSSKSPEFELNKITCLFEWNFLGNSLKALTTIPFDPYLAQISLDFGLLRALRWDVEVQLPPKKDNHPFSARGEMTLLPLLFSGSFEGSMQDWNYQGKLKLERKNGKWEGVSQPTLTSKKGFEAHPVLKMTLAEVSQLDIKLKPEDLVSKEIKLLSPLDLTWQKNPEQEVVQLQSPSIDIKLPTNELTVELKNLRTEAKRAIETKTWRVEGEIEKIKALGMEFQLKHSGLIGADKSQPVNVSGEVIDTGKEVPIRFRISRKPEVENLVATVSTEVELFPDGILAKLIRELKKGFLVSGGKIKVKGELSSNGKGKTEAFLTYGIDKLSGLINEIPFKNIHSSGSVSVLPAFKTKKMITLQADSMGSSLSLESVLAKVSLTPPDNLNVESAGAKMAGGTVSVSPFSSSISQPKGGVDIKVTHIDLEKLLRQLAGERLSGTGFLDGSIQVNWMKEGVEIPSLRFYSVGKGKIKYTDPVGSFFGKKVEYLNEFQSLLAEGNQALVMKALENFDYERIALSATRSISGKLDISLNLKGRNPDLIRGQPFDITLPISGDVESFILKSVLQSSVVDEVNKHRH